MEYALTRSAFKNEALLQTLEALFYAYCSIDAKLYVVGAVARDICLSLLNSEESPRKTLDLDVAVMLDKWGEYETLSGILVGKGFVKAIEKQRFYFITGFGLRYEVDIVPFGQIAENDMVAWPPEGNPVMSVKSFAEVMEHADVIIVDGEFKFYIAPLSGQWLIKLDAWYDRHLITGKDASDMQFILENAYINYVISRNEIPEEVNIDAETFDLTVAGAEWVASDIKKMLSHQKCNVYAELLENELIQEEESALINDLFDRSRTSSFDSIRKAIRRMAEILRG